MPRRAPGRSAQAASSREAELAALLTARERDLAGRDRALAEALAREDATASVLRAIRSSPADRPAVLHAIAAAAGRLCPGATNAIIYLADGDALRVAATWNPQPGSIQVGETRPLDRRNTAAGKAVVDRRAIYVPDLRTVP